MRTSATTVQKALLLGMISEPCSHIRLELHIEVTRCLRLQILAFCRT